MIGPFNDLIGAEFVELPTAGQYTQTGLTGSARQILTLKSDVKDLANANFLVRLDFSDIDADGAPHEFSAWVVVRGDMDHFADSYFTGAVARLHAVVTEANFMTQVQRGEL